jgi:hypothetical protein
MQVSSAARIRPFWRRRVAARAEPHIFRYLNQLDLRHRRSGAGRSETRKQEINMFASFASKTLRSALLAILPCAFAAPAFAASPVTYVSATGTDAGA